MAKSKEPTKTEIKLTVAATVLAINLSQLLAEYEALAAKNDHVVNPNIQTGIAHSIVRFANIMAKNPHLDAITKDICKQFTEFKQKHEQLDA